MHYCIFLNFRFAFPDSTLPKGQSLDACHRLDLQLAHCNKIICTVQLHNCIRHALKTLQELVKTKEDVEFAEQEKDIITFSNIYIKPLSLT